MAVQLANAYVALGVSARGLVQGIARQFAPLQGAAEESGKKSGDGFAKKMVAAVGALGIGAAAAKTFNDGLDVQAGVSKVTAQLGLTKKQAADVGKVSGDLFGQGFGTGIDQVQQSVASVIQNIDGMGSASQKTLQEISGKVVNTANIFDQDLGGVTTAVSQLMRTGLAKNATEALDIVTRGFQTGADKSGDFLDTLNEYGTQFRKLGIDGVTATGLIAQGLKAGARDGDLVADTIKEFSIRAIDGSKTTSDAYKALGLDAGKMAAQIAKGGPAAKAGLGEVLAKLKQVKDPAEQASIATGLFGTQAEDMGKALYALDTTTATKQIGNVAGAADKAGEAFNDNAKAKISTFFRGIQGAALNAVGKYVIPLFEKIPGLVEKFSGVLAPAFAVVKTVLDEVVGGVMAFTAAWQYNDGEVTSSGFAGVMERLGYAAHQTFDYFTDVVWPFLVRYQDVLVPIAAGIGAIVAAIKIWSIVTKVQTAVTTAYASAQAALNVVMSANPIALVVLAIVGLVAALVVAYQKSETFRRIVDAAWAGVKAAIAAVVDWFVNTAWPWIQQTLESIKGGFATAKARVLAIWGAIRAGLSAAWTWIKANVFDRIVAILQANALAFAVLRQKVSAVWEGIKTALKAGWDWISRNVFGNFKRGLEVLQEKFATVRDGIGKVWDGLKEKAKAPIRFVIDTVLNDGLIAGFNWLSGKIGGPKVDRIPLPKGFATGGVLPGYTPGRDVHRFYSPTGGLLDLSGGEPIMRPEFGRVVGKGWVDRMNAAARTGGVGGVRRALGQGQAFASGGIWNNIKGAVASGWDWMSDKASSVFKAVSDPLGYLKGKLKSIPGGTVLGEFAHGTADKLLGLAVSKVKSLFSAFTGEFDKSGGVGIGSNARGWQQLWSIVHKILPDIQLTSSFRPGAITALGNKSLHGMGRAIDVAPPSMAAFNAILKAFPNATQLFYGPADGRTLLNGKPWRMDAVTKRNHFDHIHLAMAKGGIVPKPLLFDKGGVLPQGTSLVHNATGAPEPLARVDRMGPRQIVIQGNVGWSPAELDAAIAQRERREASLHPVFG